MNRLVYLIVSEVRNYFERHKWREVEDSKGRMAWANDSGVEAKLDVYKYTTDNEGENVEVKITWGVRVMFRVKAYVRSNHVIDILLDGDLTVVNEPAPPVSIVSSMYVVAYELYELLNAVTKPYRP